MDFVSGLALGFFGLPWIWMFLLLGLFVFNVVLTEWNETGWSTFLLLFGVSIVAWLGGGINVFTWTWANLSSVVQFIFVYLTFGAVWSVAKWYLYLVKIRESVPAGGKRPIYAYANHHKSRITGWIIHWPFSMIGALFGDVLSRIVSSIYTMMSSMYDRIADSVFAEYDPE